ncbi:MAG: glycoside hydrolase family 55 protein [Thermoguttaceae bacterium]|nr:glycoside hydrolase family 55 protein [Thermoguttaceae bacterium]MDW8079972.1 glycosyl hydrolase family 28-related protein [Thermoguttaceae bacterium]
MACTHGLAKLVVIKLAGLALSIGLPLRALGQTTLAGDQPGVWNVRTLGALGDGRTDDTAVFQKALDAAGRASGGIVFVPAGQYRIGGTLSVPGNVRLEGIYRFAPTTRWGRSDELSGSVLLATSGRAEPAAPPFIRLAGHNASVSGLVIAYPDVDNSRVPPEAYPPCLLAEGVDNVCIDNCLLLNPYEAIRLVRAGRHLVRNVMGYPRWRGIYVDECYDIGRIENVHFWPFGVHYRPEDPLCQWINLNGVAFEFARTDWQYVLNTFCFGYGVGYKFTQSKHGSPNGNFLGIGADCCERAVVIEQCQPPGLLITNGEFVGRWTSREAITVEIKPQVIGLVSLVNCSFWGPIDRAVVMESQAGQLVLNSCHFCEWDVAQRGAPAIDLLAGHTSVFACTFRQDSRWHLRIGPKVARVLVLGMHTPGRTFIDNNAPARTTISGVPPSPQDLLPENVRRHYRLEVGREGDSPFLLLWHGPEKDQRPFRWSGPRSLVLLPVCPNEEYQLELEAAIPRHLPPKSFAVYKDNEKAADLAPGKTSFRLKAGPQPEVILELRGPGWIPAETDPRSQDQRVLGIQLFSVTARSLSGQNMPEDPILLNAPPPP